MPKEPSVSSDIDRNSAPEDPTGDAPFAEPGPSSPAEAFEATAMLTPPPEDTEEEATLPPDHSPMEPSDEQIIDGRYRLEMPLGEGGMGTVYKATHVLMDKPVAVKLIRGQLAHLPEIAARFQREAKSASRLTDPHCITVTDFGRTEDGTLFLVMELLDGKSLSDLLEREGALTPSRAIHITRQILKALIHAHGAGVVHRDLKPGNVMLVRQGEEEEFAKVFDFGIAKIVSEPDSAENLTQTGRIVGTPAYVAPEQAMGEGSDYRADLYAVGVMFYEMLAGNRPFTGKTAVDVVYAHLSAPVPALPRSCRPPRGTQRILQTALAKRPEERYQSAEDFLEALNQIDLEKTATNSFFLGVDRALYPIRSKVSGFIARHFRTLSPAVRRRLERLYSTDLVKITDPVRERLEQLHPSKRRLLFRIAVGALLLLGILGITTVLRNKQTFVKPAELEAVEKPGVDEDAIEGLFDKIDTQLTGGLYRDAETTAREALALSPTQPVAHLLLGHALFLSDRRQEAMQSYTQALSLDATLAQDERLGTHLEEGLKTLSSSQAAAGLLVKFGGTKGVEMLAAQANSALSDGEIREIARRTLVENGEKGAVDWVSSLSADLKAYKSCNRRRQIIQEIIELQNPEFLPLLRAELEKAEADKGRGPVALIRRLKLSGSDKGYRCLKRDLKRAIKILDDL